jgi:hypothetical protein
VLPRYLLILTTNHIGFFDQAFMSRVHIEIGYDPPDEVARKKKLQDDHEKGGKEVREG